MSVKQFKKISFYFRPGVKGADFWEKKLKKWVKSRYPHTLFLESNIIPAKKENSSDLLVVLGGDGTILEAAQKFQKFGPLILGLNLGHTGFLASVRKQGGFLKGLDLVLNKKYRELSRMLIKAELWRGAKKIFSGYALNDVTVQNLLGMVDVGVFVDNHLIQEIHGTGVLVATATGSTAYNLSAHGPIVMPDIKCFIITELLDHGIPTPSLIIKRNRTITLKIDDFRKKERFLIKDIGEAVDVVLALDTERIVSLKKGDRIVIKKSARLIRFAELEKNYFFRSLQEKFSFF